MHVEVRPVYSRLIGASVGLLLALEEHFKVKVPGARYIPSVRAGYWDGCVRYFKVASGSFMTGFLPELLLLIDDLKAGPVEVVRKYEVPRPGKPLRVLEREENDGVARGYQVATVDEFVRLKRGVLKAATNAGKTLIAMMIVERLGLPTLYVVTEQTLWDQTYERFKARFGEGVVGRIGAGVWQPRLITIGMVQTIAPKLTSYVGRQSVFERNMPSLPQVLIADEVHLFTGDKKRRQVDPETGEKKKKPQSQWTLLMEKIQAPYRLGMSGTPIVETETRDRNLIGLTGPLFGEISNRQLVDAGWSARPRIRFVRYEGFPRLHMEWQDAYRELIVQSRKRNAAVAELCRLYPGKRVLIMCNWAEHCRYVKVALNDADVTSVVLTGRDDIHTRKRWLTAFKAGRVQALIVTTIADQGWDVPEIDVLIMAGGGGVSLVKPLQRLGRSLRKRDDKDEVDVWDFWDEWQEDTERHSKRRFKLFKAEQLSVEVVKLRDLLNRGTKHGR